MYGIKEHDLRPLLRGSRDSLHVLINVGNGCLYSPAPVQMGILMSELAHLSQLADAVDLQSRNQVAEDDWSPRLLKRSPLFVEARDYLDFSIDSVSIFD
jgi:hypothetical protein